MTNDDDWLAHESLTAAEWKGVEALAYGAPTSFEILANLKVGQTIANRLISIGLAESGAPNSAYLARGYDVGYRLSPLGWKVKERGRHPARST